MIRAVLFDVGGVLHTAEPDATLLQGFATRVLELLSQNGATLEATPQSLIEAIVPRAKEYKRYAEKHKVELPAERVLAEFYLREFAIAPEVLKACAEEICYLYDSARQRITMRPSLPAAVQELHQMGLRQGIISNIISRTFVPEVLIRYGIAPYMECVVMSSEAGIRKPNPAIFHLALERMGIAPQEAAYVGDTISRDVIGAKDSGFGLVFQIRYPPTEHKDTAFLTSGYQADYRIEDLSEIAPIIRRHNALERKGGGSDEAPVGALVTKSMLKAMIFDMGGTLEDVVHKPEYNLPCGKLLLDYLRTHKIELDIEPEAFMAHLQQRNQDYRNWGIDFRKEIAPYELWSQWYLKDWDINQERLQAIANNLANIWERNFYKRVLRPEAPKMLQQLKDMGIAMGVISNTACQTQVIEILHEYGIHSYFKNCIYLSSLSGFRKPHPELFWAAAADLGAKPEESIYVGDTISRDVRGSRAAGYLAVIRIDSFLTKSSDAKRVTDAEEEADYAIESLMDIPPIAHTLLQSK